jgi:hypothetical protein
MCLSSSDCTDPSTHCCVLTDSSHACISRSLDNGQCN